LFFNFPSKMGTCKLSPPHCMSRSPYVYGYGCLSVRPEMGLQALGDYPGHPCKVQQWVQQWAQQWTNNGFFLSIESFWATMGHVYDQPLVDGGCGGRSPPKKKGKFMVSVESFKRIFHWLPHLSALLRSRGDDACHRIVPVQEGQSGSRRNESGID
jgi:hypothetical protein